MKKRSLSLVLAFAMILMLSCGAWAALAPNADGVYEIGTAAQLAEFRDMVNAGSNDIDGKLMANITMPDEAWMPIGHWKFDSGVSLDYTYKGVFDGNGKKIAGLKIRSSDVGLLDIARALGGFFGCLSEGGLVQNLVLTDVDIDLTGLAIGYTAAGIAANVRGGSIKNSGVVGGSIIGSTSANGAVGALAGYVASGIAGIDSVAEHKTEIINCFVDGITSIDHSNGDTGALIGIINDGATVSNCYAVNIGIVKGGRADGGGVGGIVGLLHNAGDTSFTSTLVNCYAQNIGELTAVSPRFAGAIVGIIFGHQDVQFENCAYVAGMSSATLSGRYEGGLVGRFDGAVNPNLDKLQNCIYPVDYFTFTNGPEDRPIGNISNADLAAAGRGDLFGYSVDSDDSELPAVVAALEQGYTVTLVVGETYDLDVTAIPGTMGNYVGHWESSDNDIVSWVSDSDGLHATLTANAVGTAAVTVKIRSTTLNADLTCNVIVVDAVEAETDPANSSIYLNDEDVNIVYNFEPYRVVGIDDSNLRDNGTGLSAIVDPDDDSKVLLTGKPLKSGSFFYVVTLESADGFQFTQTIPVVIQGGSRPTGGGGGSSNCNSGVGAAMFALLGLAFVYKKK